MSESTYKQLDADHSVWQPDPKRRDAVSVYVAHQRLTRNKQDEKLMALQKQTSELNLTLQRQTSELNLSLQKQSSELAQSFTERQAQAAAEQQKLERKLTVRQTEQQKAVAAKISEQQRKIDQAMEVAAAAQARANAIRDKPTEPAPTAAAVLKSIAQLRRDMKDIEIELLARVEKLTQGMCCAPFFV